MKTSNSSICRILSATCLSALCLIALSTHAATITVINTNDSGVGSLRQALASANDSDTIDCGVTGTITLITGQLSVNKSVTISGSGTNHLAVNANHASRVFYIASGKTVTISGLTIANGSAPFAANGGGIYNDHAALTLNNCVVSGNSAPNAGGGVCSDGESGSATLTVNNSSFSGNSTMDLGGGILNDGSYGGSATLTVNNSTFSGNSAVIGGGILNFGELGGSATLTLNNSTFSGNWADYAGGGICNDGALGSATMTLDNSTFSGNSAGDGGGSIYNYGYSGSATLTLNNNTFSSNSAMYGGAIINVAAVLTLSNCTVSSNSASYLGGGIYNKAFETSAVLTLNNSTFSGNSAPSGGAIYNFDGGGSAAVTIGDTILKTGASGENIFSDGAVTSLGYNLSSDEAAGVLTGMGDRINTDPMLGSLQDNGGSTFTHALLPGSPAIDAGKNFAAGATDQRGSAFLRTFDYASIANANGGDGTDIGAFEVQGPPSQYAASIQQPINADGTSVFNGRRGVVPVKFTLTLGGVATCTLPPATIAVTRTAGGVIGPIDESDYNGSADNGSNFRIANCQYAYNLSTGALGVGTYRVDIIINGQVVGSATFGLR